MREKRYRDTPCPCPFALLLVGYLQFRFESLTRELIFLGWLGWLVGVVALFIGVLGDWLVVGLGTYEWACCSASLRASKRFVGPKFSCYLLDRALGFHLFSEPSICYLRASLWILYLFGFSLFLILSMFH